MGARKMVARAMAVTAETAVEPKLGRRGLVAAAAAFAAGAMTVAQAEVVRAGSDGDIVAGGNTNTNDTTTVTGQTYYASVGPQPFRGNPIFKADASHTGENTTGLNVDGIHGVGIGTFSGVVGYGGDNSGNGVYGFGVGTAAGVAGLGGNLLGAAGVLGLGNNASANNGVGVRGTGANGGVGVEGRGGATNATGVLGFGGGTGNGQGVAGIGAASGPGVVGVGGNFGANNNADGVQGFAAGTGSGVVGNGGGSNGTGLLGFGGGGGGPGVVGQASGGFGVKGQSQGGTGVYGTTAGGYGVLGQTGTGGTFGLYGSALVNGSVGFGGVAAAPGALAGQFVGPVTHYGSIILQQQTQPPSGTVNAFIVGPGVSKNAAVLHPDGTHRLMHCVEAPEPWFEDFGEGKLTNGRAEVRLDAGFAGLVDVGKLHVFLTPHDGDHALHIAGRSATGFSVGASASAEAAARGRRGADANGTFSYRVVAKRKDVSGERLAKITLPAEIKAPPLPKLEPFKPPPEPPKKG